MKKLCVCVSVATAALTGCATTSNDVQDCAQIAAEQRRISVIFDKDKLKRVDGDVVAAGADATKKDARTATPAKLPEADTPADKKPASGAAAAGTPAAKAETVR